MERSKRRWKDLTPTQRVFVVVGAVVQVTLLVLAQRDLSRRPVGQIRGSKGLWRAATLVNFVGPLAYFCCGRRRES